MDTLRRVWRVPAAKVSILVLLGVAVLVVAGGWLAPYDPLAQEPSQMLLGPSAEHWLGTDYLGRDVLSRLMAGTRVSVAGALEAVATAALLGILPGLASAWLGPRFEWFSLRVTDTLMVIPFTVFAIAVVGTLGNGLHQSMIAIGILMSPLYFRITRAVTLGLRQQQYVEAAELMGASQWWVLRKHIWSKVLPTIAVTTAQAVGAALLVMASLTFLGLGVTPPAPTWGGMLASDLAYLAQQPWAPLYPGVMIMLTVGALNLLADIIREATPDAVRRTWRRTAPAGTGLAVGSSVAAEPVALDDPTSTELKEDGDVRVPAA
ncbi:ABC transporter permease [Nocardioides sp. cx-173]|uniref:ABC transporter permease n=1 Tax=Nocardioides sp. cx-173 TaxID=2898796 RepID=UPI001E5E1C18|nr:ABC transporter permease [Nocardioides sp. cx-173]UGB41341.1 ABC transporter permease [Nocardioides sp. cx-173]